MLLKKQIVAAMLLSLPGLSAVSQANELRVLHAGYVKPIEGKGFMPGAQPDGARLAGSTISLIKGKGVVVVVDPGMTAAGTWPGIIEKMAAEGVTPEDVTHVFISHHHPDHITRVGLFPNATLVDHWGSYKDDLWSDHPDGWEIAPGIRVLATPGHTHEDASLLVTTDQGVYALTHLWWSPGYEPAEDPLAEDSEALERSRARILKEADWIVPGHGELFKNVRKGQ